MGRSAARPRATTATPALNDRERGAQFVGDIGRHLAAQRLGPREALGHLVEGQSQVAQFVTGRDVYALSQVAGGDALSGGG